MIFVKGLTRFKAIVCIGITVIITAAAMPLVVRASLTNELIEESEKAVDEAQSEKKDLQTGLSTIKKLLNSLETAKDNLENYVTQLDASLAELTEKIEELNTQLEEKKLEIEITKDTLAIAEELEKEQYEAMKQRIRFIYEKGNTTYVELLLSANSFADFLNKTQYITKLSEYDRDMLNEYIKTKEMVAQTKATLESEQKELEEVMASIAAEQKEVENLISQKETEIVAYESDIDNKEQAIKDYEAEIAAQDAEIKALEATIAAEKKRLLEENRKAISYDGGQFKWPAPDYTRISDDYGMRMHPTLGVEKFHNGIDLASPSGSRILAAYDGEVVAATYSPSMGNYIMIDHGDSLYTIYMHASALLVSRGDMVVKGEQIAKVGSTGRSTGPHLHFGVRLEGDYISPWKYIK